MKFIKIRGKLEKMKGYQLCKNDVLSTVFCYARYIMGMENLIHFGMKNSLTLPSLGDYFFKSLGDENDEPIYTYTEQFMRKLVRQSIKGGRFNSYSQHHKSTFSDEVFVISSEDLDIKGNICEILDK